MPVHEPENLPRGHTPAAEKDPRGGKGDDIPPEGRRQKEDHESADHQKPLRRLHRSSSGDSTSGATVSVTSQPSPAGR